MLFHDPKFIFYYHKFRKYDPFSIGHEIGHAAAEHNFGQLPKPQQENGANYFSARLNGSTLAKMKVYRILAALIGLPGCTSSMDKASVERETDILLKRGVPKKIVEEVKRLNL